MKSTAKLIAIASALSAGWIHALPDDRSKPIEIQANSAERDSKTGVTTYIGNVDIQQGSIHISANTVVLDSKNNELTQINAIGSPATYTQQLTGPDDTVDARANKIHFNVAKDLITLQGNGALKQQSGSITGEHIEYDIKAERVKAQAAEPGSSDNGKRITVIIPANKKTSNDPEPTETAKKKP
jgi:lipopolysaccharide export system protein LptA